MKKSTGRARPQTVQGVPGRSTRGAVARPAPVEFDVGEGPAVKIPPRPVAAETFEVGEGPAFQRLDTSGIGQEFQPLEVGGAAWQCRYGCPGVRNAVADLEMHTFDCPYWEREGKDKTPF